MKSVHEGLFIMDNGIVYRRRAEKRSSDLIDDVFSALAKYESISYFFVYKKIKGWKCYDIIDLKWLIIKSLIMSLLLKFQGDVYIMLIDFKKIK